MLNYVQGIRNELTRALPDCDGRLLDLYTLLALTRGTDVSLEDVHDAWSIWQNGTRPDHPCLRPFAELSAETQELDRKYRDSIAESASIKEN